MSDQSTTKMSEAQTKKRTGPLTFLAQVRQEARKVTWTSWKETSWATVMVVIMVVASSIFFLATDLIVKIAVQLITNVGAVNNG